MIVKQKLATPTFMWRVFNTWGSVFIGTTDGLAKTTGRSREYRYYYKLTEADNQVNAIFAQDSLIFFGTDAGLYVSRESIFFRALDAKVTSIKIHKNELYVGASSGLLVSEDAGNTFTMKTTQDGLGLDNIRTILVNEKDVFIGTDAGLQRRWQ